MTLVGTITRPWYTMMQLRQVRNTFRLKILHLLIGIVPIYLNKPADIVTILFIEVIITQTSVFLISVNNCYDMILELIKKY